MEKTLQKELWVDNVKLTATIAVIVLHVASPAVFTEFNPSGNLNTWWIANFYDSFCRFCVPLFIMITGALLLPQQIGLKLFLRKRLNRILFPFIFWTGVYIVFNLGLKIRDGGGAAALDNFWSWLFIQLVKGPSIHLWYVYMIIGLYLFIPIVKPWIQQASNQAVIYFLGIWLIIVIVNQLKIIKISSPFDVSYFGSYLGYLVLGYYLSEKVIITKALQKTAVIIFILGFLTTLIGTYIASQQNNFFSTNFYEYLTINVVFAAIGMFIFIKSWPSNETKSSYVTIRNFINKYGFGIYLGHVLILNILSHFGVDYCLTTPWLSIPFVAIICLIITCLMIYILDKLPYGKYVAR